LLRRLRERFTYANVMSTLAVFLVLGTGTAYATHELIKSSDVVDETLISADLKNGSAVKSSDVINDSLEGADIKEGTLGQVQTATLGGLGRTAASTGNCIPPENDTYIRCVQVQLDLAKPARVLLNGRVTVLNEEQEPNVHTSGSCRWGGVQTSGPVEVTAEPDQRTEMSLVGLTNVVPAGQGWTFAIECREAPFHINGSQYIDVWMTAVAISPS
jgi:hypothetical protein